jgi:hypothetical protein
MPLLREPGFILHGPARAELVILSNTILIWADYVTPVFSQIVYPGLPFMLPAAFMYAAWAPQPDLFTAPMGEVNRHLAHVEGWVPHAVDELVIGVCQRLLPLVIELHACYSSQDKQLSS